MKMVIEVIDGIVTRCKQLEDAVMAKTTQDYPYNTIDDLGNPYAESLRKIERSNSSGHDAELIVLDEGMPKDYIHKAYDKATKTFMSDITDAERIQRYRIKQTKYRIPSEHVNLHPDRAQLDECKRVYGEEFSNSIVEQIVGGVHLTKPDMATLDHKLDKLSEPVRLMVINQVANSLILDTDVEDGIYWWSKLLGTSLHIRGKTGVAAEYVIALNYDKAVQVLNELIEDSKTPEYKKEEIRAHIVAIGIGQGIYSQAVEAYEAGDFLSVYSFCEEFLEVATGGVYKTFYENVKHMRAQALGRLGREEGEPILIQEAVDIFEEIYEDSIKGIETTKGMEDDNGFNSEAARL